MKGAQLVAALERERFTVRRRSSQFVWLERGGQALLVDVSRDVADIEAMRILDEARRGAPDANVTHLKK